MTAPAREAHTLRGVAGNIGATALQEAAARLEAACMVPEAATASYPLAETERLLNEVLASLVHLQAPEQARQATLSSAELLALMLKLKTMLQDSDAEALSLISGLTERVTDGSVLQALKPILKAVEQYDFDLALTRLDQYLGKPA